MIAKEKKSKIMTRLLLWINKRISGKGNIRLKRNKRENEDLEWLNRFKPALDEVLGCLSGVPKEVKEGILNYVISKISKKLYPLRYERLNRSLKIAICVGLSQDHTNGSDLDDPPIFRDICSEVLSAN